MNRFRTGMAVAAAILVLIWGPVSAAPPKDREAAGLPGAALTSDAEPTMVLRPDQLPQLLGSTPVEPWAPEVNPEQLRDLAVIQVFQKVAPASVVVRCGSGHGSGFFVDPAGWLVTNHHVIADAATDPKTGAQVAIVHVGQMGADRMQLVEEGLPALVYKASEEKDLALLKLTRLPNGWKEVPYLRLAAEAPRPGQRCFTVAHPSAGILWTLRTGFVSGIGQWPHDLLDAIMQRLGLESDAARRKFEADLAAVRSQMKVVLSECGLNPGDSGGALVNRDGELIAVNFAVPLPDPQKGIRRDRFSYHVHIDEVREFLAERPQAPLVYVPEAWPVGLFYSVLDLDQDGVPDSLVVRTRPVGPPAAVLVDLDQDSAPRLRTLPLDEIVATRAWDFEFAIHFAPPRRAFYDTNHDGAMNLILEDAAGDGVADRIWRLSDGTWALREAEGQPWLNPSLIDNQAMAQRLRRVLAAIGL